MTFNVFSTLEYSIQDQSTFIFNISAFKNPSQTIVEETLHVEPYITAEELYSQNVFSRSIRLMCHSEPLLRISYNALVNTKYGLIPRQLLHLVPIHKLPAEVVPFLFPSRYCQSDKLIRLAQDKFGNIENGYDKVMAICRWIGQNVEYVIGSTDSKTSAIDTVTQRIGVCRDFAHLGITLCRALAIPARYFSCYSHQLQPEDFHACFEAYLGGHWISFDPSQLAPLNGLVRIGTGRDAADVSLATIYGNVFFRSMKVTNDIQEGYFEPITMQDLNEQGICIDLSAAI